MSTGQALQSDLLAESMVQQRSIPVKLTITTSAVSASVSIVSDNPAVQAYWFNGTTTYPSITLADSGANFGSLTTTSGSVIGILITDGDAASYRFTSLSATSDLTPSITAIVPAPCGASSSGITASGNVALTLGLTGMTLVATATTQSVGLVFQYKQDV